MRLRYAPSRYIRANGGMIPYPKTANPTSAWARSLIKDVKGAMAIEYGLIMSLVGAAIIAGVLAMSCSLGSIFGGMATVFEETTGFSAGDFTFSSANCGGAARVAGGPGDSDDGQGFRDGATGFAGGGDSGATNDTFASGYGASGYGASGYGTAKTSDFGGGGDSSGGGADTAAGGTTGAGGTINVADQVASVSPSAGGAGSGGGGSDEHRSYDLLALLVLLLILDIMLNLSLQRRLRHQTEEKPQWFNRRLNIAQSWDQNPRRDSAGHDSETFSFVR